MTGCCYCKAREFDSLLFSCTDEFGSVGVLAAAAEPRMENNLGSLGIKSNIERSRALTIIRRNAAKKLKLDVDQIGKVKYRATHLHVIQQYIETHYGTN
jgi:hypothetical protein